MQVTVNHHKILSNKRLHLILLTELLTISRHLTLHIANYFPILRFLKFSENQSCVCGPYP